MTREKARELLPVIQAFVEGKTIQFSHKDIPEKWADLDHEYPAFESIDTRWRIKPEPREFWLVMEEVSFAKVYKQPVTSCREVIHVIEVLK